MTQNSATSSFKSKDHYAMTQTTTHNSKESLNQTDKNTSEPIKDSNENKNGRMVVINEGTLTSGSTSAKSSVKEPGQNQKAPNHRKSKSQNRARKALRTITFILGMSFFYIQSIHVDKYIQSVVFLLNIEKKKKLK